MKTGVRGPSATPSVTPLKALADPVRARICELLGSEELCPCHLVEELSISQPLLSHHLRVLRESGIVETRRQSYWTYYRLSPDALEKVASDMLGLATRAREVTSARPCCA